MDYDARDAACQALREAVNAAWNAGADHSLIVTVVKDQLLGIEHLGVGDVEKMQQVAREVDERMRRMYYK